MTAMVASFETHPVTAVETTCGMSNCKFFFGGGGEGQVCKQNPPFLKHMLVAETFRALHSDVHGAHVFKYGVSSLTPNML